MTTTEYRDQTTNTPTHWEKKEGSSTETAIDKGGGWLERGESE